MMLNSVVLPEPLGPISPVMLPCATSIVQSLSACTPPNALAIPSVRSALLLTPPPLSPVIAPSRYPGGDELARGRQHAARHEQDDHQEQHAQQDLAQVVVRQAQVEVQLDRLEHE